MEKLLDALKEYCASDALPMHMPGHKRNVRLLSLPDPAGIDITEIDGFDNLHGAEDILLRCQQRAAQVFGAEETHFLINGTTAGILSAVTGCVRRGGTLLLARNSHKSALNAVTIGGITPVYLYPDYLSASGISGAMSPAHVSEMLDAHPEAKCVLITSPTYEGVISDIAAIADVCHRHNAVLIVDEAHGAHLGFGGFPQSAIRLGADIAVQSVHKTLGSLTQTALIHMRGSLADRARVRKMLTIYQTSSPSYILMASIDECVCRMAQQGDTLADDWLRRMADFRRRMGALKHLKLLPVEDVLTDPSKMVISAAGTEITGVQLMRRLRDEFRIELEMSAGHYVIGMSGIGDTDETLCRFADALLTIDETLTSVPETPLADLLTPRPKPVLTPAEADELPHEAVPVREAAGRICAEAVWAYPPGIPLIVPGERIDAARLSCLARQQKNGVALHSETGMLPDCIRCVKE